MRIDDIIRGSRLFLIAGPCAIESETVCFTVAENLAELSLKHDLPVIFKSSYTKANRLSADSFSGHGMEFGLNVLADVKKRFDLPLLTDVHETAEISATADVVDVIQIPAFLCRQTELVRQAGATGKWVNIKKGQFIAPEDMDKIADKAGTDKVILTERGASFGYHNLVVDFRSFIIMKQFGYPLVYDVTHSLQLPGGAGTCSGGQPEFAIPMARAGVAVGVNGLFIETHPDPPSALCDAGSMIPLSQMDDLITQVMNIRQSMQA
ncbi:MAG: 3-deoxy-8-phosphooctulonate synthase [candidate division Zixibacteria bacterium]|nr:3-deoxy-8-phosphooctulonate synthase [candidate division Zixibacteria bacterium]